MPINSTSFLSQEVSHATQNTNDDQRHEIQCLLQNSFLLRSKPYSINMRVEYRIDKATYNCIVMKDDRCRDIT